MCSKGKMVWTHKGPIWAADHCVDEGRRGHVGWSKISVGYPTTYNHSPFGVTVAFHRVS